MQLTKNFTLEELVATKTGVENKPTKEIINNLRNLAEKVLQPARDKYGKSITINSGYRSKLVNSKVGGSIKSSHLTGEAADITTGNKEQNRILFAIIETLEFDQLIDEKDMSWIHVSYKASGNRKQKLKL